MCRLKSIVAVFLVLFVFLTISENTFAVTNTTKEFTDTHGHWAESVINKWVEYQLINGYSDGRFGPNDPISRADLCVILNRLLSLKYTSYNYYYDLPNNNYYTEAVLKCVAAGYVTGTSSTTVDPLGKATREQVATIICRMLKLDTTGYNSVRKFSDDLYISSWARPYVYTMRKYGYMNGSGNNMVNPRANITRAEVVQLLNNVAGAYMPKTDITQQGSEFVADFSGNLMTARTLSLSNSTISNDLVLTQSATSLNLSNCKILGRLLVMSKSQISLGKSSIHQLYLSEKCTVYGLTDNVEELYISEYASESSLDAIPKMLILEPGVRVEIKGVMYENETNNNKVYYGIEIKESIAEEQGFVTGGPRISSYTMTQEIDNTIKVSNIRVIAGDNAIKEIGVVYMKERENEEIILPTYKKNDGKIKYSGNNYSTYLEMSAGRVLGYTGYRIYAVDDKGLYGYSSLKTFTPFDFSMSMHVYDDNYPQKIRAEVILEGENIPNINEVKIYYGSDATYNEGRNFVDGVLYTDNITGTKLDNTKYRRYYGTVYSTGIWNKTTNNFDYEPPTYFGVKITFYDNTIINQYPVLSNVIPEGAKPVSALSTGYAQYKTNYILIQNNSVKTKYIEPQEVGIVYKFTKTDTIIDPTANENGWVCLNSGLTLGVNESSTWNAVLSALPTDGYIQYAAYIKTSNGYWYGDVYCIPSDIKGDIGGYTLTEAHAEVIGDGEALLSISYTGNDISESSLISFGDSIGTISLSNLEHYINTNSKKLYVVLRNLDINKVYNLQIRVIKNTSEKSNLVSCPFNAGNQVNVYLTNKQEKNNYITYTLKNETSATVFLKTATLVKELLALDVDYYDCTLILSSDLNKVNDAINVTFDYYIMRGSSGTVYFPFHRTVTMY